MCLRRYFNDGAYSRRILSYNVLFCIIVAHFYLYIVDKHSITPSALFPVYTIDVVKRFNVLKIPGNITYGIIHNIILYTQTL